MWTVGTLAVGAQTTLMLTGTFAGTVTSQLTRTVSSPTDPNAANDTFTLTPRFA